MKREIDTLKIITIAFIIMMACVSTVWSQHPYSQDDFSGDDQVELTQTEGGQTLSSGGTGLFFAWWAFGSAVILIFIRALGVVNKLTPEDFLIAFITGLVWPLMIISILVLR